MFVLLDEDHHRLRQGLDEPLRPTQVQKTHNAIEGVKVEDAHRVIQLESELADARTNIAKYQKQLQNAYWYIMETLSLFEKHADLLGFADRAVEMVKVRTDVQQRLDELPQPMDKGTD